MAQRDNRQMVELLSTYFARRNEVALMGNWIELPDLAWAYVSATRISMTGASSIFQIGDEIRLKQGGGYKWFSVIGATATYFDVTGGSDFSVANAAITDAAFSKGGGVGHPVWYNWTPTYSGFSADPTSVSARFMLIGNTCYVNIRMPNDGTSNAVTFSLTSPLTAATVTNALWSNSISLYVNGGTASYGSGLVYIASGGSSFVLATAGGVSGWTASGGKRGYFQLLYQI